MNADGWGANGDPSLPPLYPSYGQSSAMPTTELPTRPYTSYSNYPPPLFAAPRSVAGFYDGAEGSAQADVYRSSSPYPGYMYPLPYDYYPHMQMYYPPPTAFPTRINCSDCGVELESNIDRITEHLSVDHLEYLPYRCGFAVDSGEGNSGRCCGAMRYSRSRIVEHIRAMRHGDDASIRCLFNSELNAKLNELLATFQFADNGQIQSSQAADVNVNDCSESPGFDETLPHTDATANNARSILEELTLLPVAQVAQDVVPPLTTQPQLKKGRSSTPITEPVKTEMQTPISETKPNATPRWKQTGFECSKCGRRLKQNFRLHCICNHLDGFNRAATVGKSLVDDSLFPGLTELVKQCFPDLSTEQNVSKSQIAQRPATACSSHIAGEGRVKRRRRRSSVSIIDEHITAIVEQVASGVSSLVADKGTTTRCLTEVDVSFFESKKLLKRRFRLKCVDTADESQLTCALCQVETKTYDRHVWLHIKAQPLKCFYCDFRANMKVKTVKVHIKTKHPGEIVKVIDERATVHAEFLATKYRCFPTLQVKKGPEELRAGKRIVCSLCKALLGTKAVTSHIFLHISQNSGQFRYACRVKQCAYGNNRKEALASHVQSVHSNALDKILDRTDEMRAEYWQMKAKCFPQEIGTHRPETPPDDVLLGQTPVAGKRRHSLPFSNKTPLISSAQTVNTANGNCARTNRKRSGAHNGNELEVSDGKEMALYTPVSKKKRKNGGGSSSSVNANTDAMLLTELKTELIEEAVTALNVTTSSGRKTPSKRPLRDTCRLCGKPRGQSYMRHVLVHVAMPMFSCPQCDYSTNSDSSSMTKHARSVHKNPEPSPFIDHRHKYSELIEEWTEKCFGVTEDDKNDLIEETNVKEVRKRTPANNSDDVRSHLSNKVERNSLTERSPSMDIAGRSESNRLDPATVETVKRYGGECSKCQSDGHNSTLSRRGHSLTHFQRDLFLCPYCFEFSAKISRNPVLTHCRKEHPGQRAQVVDLTAKYAKALELLLDRCFLLKEAGEGESQPGVSRSSSASSIVVSPQQLNVISATPTDGSAVTTADPLSSTVKKDSVGEVPKITQLLVGGQPTNRCSLCGRIVGRANRQKHVLRKHTDYAGCWKRIFRSVSSALPLPSAAECPPSNTAPLNNRKTDSGIAPSRSQGSVDSCASLREEKDNCAEKKSTNDDGNSGPTASYDSASDKSKLTAQQANGKERPKERTIKKRAKSCNSTTMDDPLIGGKETNGTEMEVDSKRVSKSHLSLSNNRPNDISRPTTQPSSDLNFSTVDTANTVVHDDGGGSTRSITTELPMASFETVSRTTTKHISAISDEVQGTNVDEISEEEDEEEDMDEFDYRSIATRAVSLLAQMPLDSS